MPTDAERLNWLAEQEGAALVSDDNGHWAVTWDGMQNAPMTDGPCDIQTTFFIEAKDWHPDIRSAIDAAASRSSQVFRPQIRRAGGCAEQEEHTMMKIRRGPVSSPEKRLDAEEKWREEEDETRRGEEESPKELMARLTDEVEQRIAKAFSKPPQRGSS